jgi:SagB-type dehydrogenase family enzyme
MPTRPVTLLSAASGGGSCWELFHENSKLGRVSPRRGPAGDQTSQPSEFLGCPAFDLAAPQPFEPSLDAAIVTPRATGVMRPGRIWRDTLAALLLSRSAAAGAASSAVEVWFHAIAIDGMPAGLYRPDRERGRVVLVRGADLTGPIASALAKPELASRAALQFFIVADLAHLAARHGERGYRYALIEAGRIARNLDLVASALGLLAVTTGEFRDREIDALLGIDGLATAALLMVAVGKTGRGSEQRETANLGSPQRGRRRRRRGRR